MRLRTTILLILANAITAYLIWHFESGRDITPTIAAPLFSADIREITVNGPGVSHPYTLTKSPRGWRVTAPFEWEAGAAADYIVEQLRFLKTDGGFSLEEARANGSTLANFGLETPAARLTVQGEGQGKPIVLAIGLVPVAGGESLVRLLTPDNQIIPASRKFYESIVLHPSTLRSNTIFNIETYQVRNIAVRTTPPPPAAEHQIRIKSDHRPLPDTADTERFWQFEIPFYGEASKPLVDAAVARLATLRCLRFPNTSADATPEQIQTLHGLTFPTVRLTLEGNNLIQTLLIGARDPESPPASPAVFAKLENNRTIFTVSESVVRDWRNAATRLREREFFNFHPDQLTEITIYRGEREKIVLHRRSNDPSKNNGHTAALAPAAAAATTAPALTPAPAQVGTATGVPAPADSANSGSTPTFTTFSSPLPPLSGDPTNAADYTDWNIPALPGTTARTTLPADPGTIRSLIQDLRHLSAFAPLVSILPPDMEKYCEAFVTDTPTNDELVTLGFKTPDRRVELAFKDGTRRTLLLARPGTRGLPWHAKLDDSPSIYSIRADIAELLSTSPAKYRQRLVVRLPDGAEITGLKITALDTQKALLDVRRPGPDSPLSAALTALPEKERSAVLALVTQLSTLRAKEYLPDAFSPDYKHTPITTKTPVGWRYRLEVSVRFPGAKTDETREIFFTDRLGGTLQIAGAPTRNCVFEIEQSLIDALSPLTLTKDGGTDVPHIVPPPDLPPHPAPIPAAAAVPTAETGVPVPAPVDTTIPAGTAVSTPTPASADATPPADAAATPPEPIPVPPPISVSAPGASPGNNS
ncbi:MAG: DUF4340 domain-containing protein [Puniceicoccales bacterium]|jgi:hypothetical protein|nr:DUF4340 domain-containing protein [Puniceicoccales bacterium]